MIRETLKERAGRWTNRSRVSVYESVQTSEPGGIGIGSRVISKRTVLDDSPRSSEDQCRTRRRQAAVLHRRGHLTLAEEMAERGFARTSDFAAGLQILAQLRSARGKFDEAVILYDRAIEMVEPGTDSMVHLVGLKCLALLAAGDRAALDAIFAITDLTGVCPSEIELTLALVLAPADRQLPPALGQALASIGSDGAASAIEYAYFTSARQLTSERARANLMRGLVTHVTNLYGEQSIPPFVLASTGLTAAV